MITKNGIISIIATLPDWEINSYVNKDDLFEFFWGLATPENRETPVDLFRRFQLSFKQSSSNIDPEPYHQLETVVWDVLEEGPGKLMSIVAKRESWANGSVQKSSIRFLSSSICTVGKLKQIKRQCAIMTIRSYLENHMEIRED